jgi:hypothetical protein
MKKRESAVSDAPTATAREKTVKTPKAAPEKPAAAEMDRDEPVGKTGEGRTVFEGSRGGHYYLSDRGDKVYVKDFVGAKVIGKTADGKTIYEGPRGGHFYYNDKGDKVYVRKN